MKKYGKYGDMFRIGFLIRYVSPYFMLGVLFALCCSAAPSFAQSLEIQGKILNGTLQTEGNAEQVTLLGLGQGMQEISTLKDVRGLFKFAMTEDKQGPFLLRATYRGVNYFKSIGPMQAQSQTPHEIVVYEQIDSLNSATVKLPHLFIKRDQDQLIFAWNFEVNNPTSTTMHRPGGIFQVGIPDGVESLNVSAAGSGMPLKVALTKDPASGAFFVNYPIKPGKTNFEVSYAVDYTRQDYTLEQKVFYPLSKVVALIYPEDMRVVSEGLKEIQVDAANHVKIAGWDNVLAGATWRMTVQGGSKIAEPVGHETHQSADHEVVERPPAIAKAKWWIWGLLALGLGLNILLFVRQKSLSPSMRFDFPSLAAYQQKLTQLQSERKNGRIDQKTFEQQQRTVLKEAWKTYLKDSHGS